MSQKRNKVQIPQVMPQKKKLYVLIGIITFLKLIIIPNIPQVMPDLFHGAWLGADGETYFAASKVLKNDGIFSDDNLLIYYAPGYSVFLYLLTLISGKFLLILTSVVQTLTFSYATLFLSLELSKTKIKKAAVPFAIIALLNPTLSLSSLLVGYESLIASLSALSLGLLIRDFNSKDSKKNSFLIIISALLLGSSIWLSPRMLAPALLFILTWLILKKPIKKNLVASLVAILVLLSFQGAMLVRNYVATGNVASQTSLGNLALMGAGPKASGTYMTDDTGIECNINGLNENAASNRKLRCAFNWYLENPAKGLLLLWKKSYYLWSPWYGPLSGGTMARNPYLIFHPIKSNITTQSQLNIVSGIPGQLVSWIWILGGWILMIFGFRRLVNLGGTERVLAIASMIIILSTWLTVLVVQGDNRYRIPLLPLSLLLQVCGYQILSEMKFLKLSARSSAPRR